jgi:CHASE2 domain-containing sensor protein
VVLASTYGSRSQERYRLFEYRGPITTLLGPSVPVGFIDLWFDPDGYVRRFSPIRQIGDAVARSFSLTIAERYTRAPVVNATGGALEWKRDGRALPLASDAA